jgi:hypothetical protein
VLTKTRISRCMLSLSRLWLLRTEVQRYDRFCSAACTRYAEVAEGDRKIL